MDKFINKNALGILLLLIGAISISACGDSNGPNDNPDPNAYSWGNPDNLLFDNEYYIWPDEPPMSEGTTAPGNEFWETNDVGGDSVHLVSEPTIRVYLPTENYTGAAAIICPGGGYVVMAIGKEGYDIAEYFQAHGIAGVVLKY